MTGVSINTRIVITFNEPLRSQQPNGAITVITTGGGNQVAGGVSVNGDTLTFTLDNPLDYNTQYTVNFADARELAGNRAGAGRARTLFTFTTGPRPTTP